jgi:hypothetical protein
VSGISFTPDGRIISIGQSTQNLKAFTPQATNEIFEASVSESPRYKATQYYIL